MYCIKSRNTEENFAELKGNFLLTLLNFLIRNCGEDDAIPKRSAVIIALLNIVSCRLINLFHACDESRLSSSVFVKKFTARGERNETV